MVRVLKSWGRDCRPKYDKKLIVIEDELLQRSYPGEKEHITPRCHKCFDKAIKEEKDHDPRAKGG